MESFQAVERTPAPVEVFGDIEMAHEAADALRSLDGGSFRSKAEVTELIEAYKASIVGIDEQTLLAEKLVVFPGSARLQ